LEAGPSRLLALPKSTWVAGIGISLLLVLAAVSSGFGGLLIMLGLVALVTGLYVASTRRRSWARLPRSRRVGAGVAAGALIVLITGSAVYGATNSTTTSAAIVPTSTPTPTAATPASTPTPTPFVDPNAEPDASERVQLGPDASVVITDSSATTARAIDVLATLPVKGRAPKTGYDRSGMYGAAWLDTDRNGCDTRNDILARDLLGTKKSGPCKVLRGTLADPYTGKTIQFVRGNATSLRVQIDHVVSLLDSWQSGAQQLTQAQRVSLANDPLNLYAVDGSANAQKGAGNAATWLPSNKSFRCAYVARQVSVKATYGLWVTEPERAAIERVLASCPDQPAFSSAFAPAPPAPEPEPAPVPAPAPEPEPESSPAPPPAPEPAPAPAPEPAPAPAPYFQNCDAARAAGAAPVHAGHPGYGRHLDRDGDGTGCE
jgi:outer membrane biosynthesis protein TonB